jgi:hypothetical protein
VPLRKELSKFTLIKTDVQRPMKHFRKSTKPWLLFQILKSVEYTTKSAKLRLTSDENHKVEVEEAEVVMVLTVSLFPPKIFSIISSLAQIFREEVVNELEDLKIISIDSSSLETKKITTTRIQDNKLSDNLVLYSFS